MYDGYEFKEVLKQMLVFLKESDLDVSVYLVDLSGKGASHGTRSGKVCERIFPLCERC